MEPHSWTKPRAFLPGDTSPKVGIHPDLAALLKAEANRLRQQAEEVKRRPSPPPPTERQAFYGASLADGWEKAWRSDCLSAADSLTEAASQLESHAQHALSQTYEFINWRRS